MTQSDQPEALTEADLETLERLRLRVVSSFATTRDGLTRNALESALSEVLVGTAPQLREPLETLLLTTHGAGWRDGMSESHDSNHKSSIYAGFIVLIFFVLILGYGFYLGTLTPEQRVMVRVALASAAAISTVLIAGGSLRVEMNVKNFSILGTGALAVFAVVFYFLSPYSTEDERLIQPQRVEPIAEQPYKQTE